MSSSTPYIPEEVVEVDRSETPNSGSQHELPVTKKSSAKITDYKPINFIGFLFACFSAISFTVFMTSTQTFFITDVLGISQRLGSYVGTLGFCDELLALILVPFIGAWSDRVGSRPIQVLGCTVVASSFLGYALFARSVYPGMLFWRLVFSAGTASLTSTMMVMLIEVNNSNFHISDLKKLIPSARSADLYVELDQDDFDDEEDNDEEAATQEAVNKINSTKKEGKRTSTMGVASGLGAIFAVSVYLRLPVRYADNNPASEALKKSYYTVAAVAFTTALILLFSLYKDDKKKFFKDDIEELFEGLEDEEEFTLSTKENYLDSLKHGATISIKNPVILMSYMGSFMARVTTIVVAVFLPFYINNYYFKSGKCATHDSDRLHCRDSYILASILSGISHSVALILAPIVGILIDRINNHLHMLLAANMLSIISAIGMTFISKPDESVLIYLWVSLLGVSEISFIIVSTTMLSNVNSKEKYYNHKGAISGCYSFVGGIGILIMSKVGGLFGDWFTAGPFVIYLLCNLIFLLVMFLLKGAKENDERTFRDLLAKSRRLITRSV